MNGARSSGEWCVSVLVTIDLPTFHVKILSGWGSMIDGETDCDTTRCSEIEVMIKERHGMYPQNSRQAISSHVDL